MKQTFLILFFIIFAFSNNLHGQNQMELNFEAKAKYEKSDAELNKTYKKLMGLLDSKFKKRLTETQRIWLKFRDSTCDFESDQYEGGSIQPLIYFNCLENQTQKRIEDLKNNLTYFN